MKLEELRKLSDEKLRERYGELLDQLDQITCLSTVVQTEVDEELQWIASVLRERGISCKEV
jgi:ribosome assembly protein YihI (activator of Der GTPase)